ncbi:hypothetical protein CLAIMM_14669 [Cladophialophora immunda]|nr:hypothetical protein CLAIMM_14669 [Cladophialophora immunda]
MIFGKATQTIWVGAQCNTHQQSRTGGLREHNSAAASHPESRTRLTARPKTATHWANWWSRATGHFSAVSPLGNTVIELLPLLAALSPCFLDLIKSLMDEFGKPVE